MRRLRLGHGLAVGLLALCFAAPPGFVAAPPLAAREAPRPAYLSASALFHIMARHGPESRAPGAGKFAPGTSAAEIRAMITAAVRAGTPRPDTGGRPDTLYDYRFSAPIGTSIDGRPTRWLRVVVAPDGYIVTAYPH